MGTKKTTEEFIRDARDVHGQKYRYEKCKYVRGKDKVEIICSKHGSFFMTPNNHLKGAGCRPCSVDNRKQCERLDTSTFILKAKEMYGDRYDYSLVDYKGIMKPIDIICKEHGTFSSIPNNHLRGSGCQLCGVKKGRESWLKDENLFSEQVEHIHGKKYSYDFDEYVNSSTHLTVLCDIHGSFKVTPDNLLRGKGCPICGCIKSYKRYYKDRELCYLYILELDFNSGEYYYKVGGSYNPEKRAVGILNECNRIPAGRLVYTYENTPETIYYIEQVLHRDFSNFRETPPILFKGYTECYNDQILLEVLETIQDISGMGDKNDKTI